MCKKEIMKQIYTIVFLLLIPLFSFAQRGNGQGRPGAGQGEGGIVLKGKVMDESSGQALEFATVSLYKQRDSSLVNGTVTDIDGNFMMKSRPGKFFATIEFLAYSKKTIPTIILTPEQHIMDMGTISLSESATELSEVEVIAEKSTMELKLDKRVFNVGKDLANTGGSAAEILDNVPSVSVDVEGTVSLRGSENVKILIDGKPSGLVGVSGSDALRQMQGDMVQSVEVITNPSARYEAEGEVGIINIVLKKGKKKGVNGSFGLTAGYPHNYGASYSLNYRKNKVNLFSNFGISFRENIGGGFENRFNGKGGNLIYESVTEHSRQRLGGNIQLGMDYYLSEKSIVTISGLYKNSDGNNPASVTYKDYDDEGVLFSDIIRNNDETEESVNLEAAFGYQKLFDKKDQKWTFDFKLIERDETEVGAYSQTDFFNSSPLDQKSNSTEDERNILLQTDYVHPFSDDGKFEIGARVNFRTIENNYLVEQKDENGIWQVYRNDDDFAFEDDFTYEENIYAGYMMYGNKIDKFSYQFGMRAEFSDIETISKEVSNPRDYLNWFPSAHLTYSVSEANQFQLSYSRRLSRPRFWYLVPFLTFTDIRNNFQGNPDLNPEYTGSYEFGYLKFFDKGSFLTSIYYRHISDKISRVTIPGENGNAARLPINLPFEDNYGLELNFNYDITKKWKINANANLYRARLDATEYTGEYKEYLRDVVDFNTMTARLNNRMTILQDVTFQVDFNYRAPRHSAQGSRKALYVLNTAFSKDILKDKGTITLSLKDIFNSRIRRGVTDIPGFYSESEYQWRASQQVVFNFIYRLNQKKKRGGYGRGGGGYEGGGDF